MSLRQIKAHVRERTRAENVITLDKGIIRKMQVADSNYINRKKEDEAEKLLSQSRKREKLRKREEARGTSRKSKESKK